MPFELCNSPAVFQHVLMGVHAAEGSFFLCVNIDDGLVFSRTLREHLEHLSLIIQHLMKANLKLKPAIFS